MGNDSWMDKNALFEEEGEENHDDRSRGGGRGRGGGRDRGRGEEDGNNGGGRNFRDNFRETRVFVQGIPDHVNWQELKDHFRLAGNVVFASVSVDRETRRSKGHGIVQYETVEEAERAVSVMRDNPIDGATLYVRPDAQEGREGRTLRPPKKVVDRDRPDGPSRRDRFAWRRADFDDDDVLSKDEVALIEATVRARDAARRRRDYESADRMRDDLRRERGVRLNDRSRLWWWAGNDEVDDDDDESPERRASSSFGEEWRRVPASSPDLDLCVPDPTLVEALLVQRDVARREKDFRTADAVLAEIVGAADADNVVVRVHDHTRTWRVWSEESPRRGQGGRPATERNNDRHGSSSSEPIDPATQCLNLVARYDPDKTDEVRMLLKSFPGREYNILKKLRQRYVKQ